MSTIFVVGIGPGAYEKMTIEAADALRNCDVIIGYTVYVDLVKEHFAGKEFLTTPMRKEVERCRLAFETAAEAISRYFGDCETLYAADTYQFDDYSKYHANVFDLDHKIKQRDVQFPIYLQQAYELGRRVCSQPAQCRNIAEPAPFLFSLLYRYGLNFSTNI